MKYFAVTTSLRENENLTTKAKKISHLLNAPFFHRRNQGIQDMIESNDMLGILVVCSSKITFISHGGEFFYHPGIAKLRIKEIKNGKTDQMIKAMDLKHGDSLLDCTLGLGSDALIASYFTGSGNIIGLEKSTIIGLIVSEGMKSYVDNSDPDLMGAMRKIKVISTDHRDYIKTLPDNSVDIVYFDPMFRAPNKKSCSINTLRPLADYAPLSQETIKDAFRVARKRVVIKESSTGTELSRLGIRTVSGGKHSSIAYGILIKGGV